MKRNTCLSAAALSALLAVSACNPPDTSTESGEPAPTEGSGTDEPIEGGEEARTAPYEVHEWGLVRFMEGGTPELATSGFATAALGLPTDGSGDATVEGILNSIDEVGPAVELPGTTDDPDIHSLGVTGKPLLYFHPLPGFSADTEISVEIAIASGQLHELWPTTGGEMVDASTYRWPRVRIAAGETCGGELAPSSDSPHCVALGSPACEAAEMREYLDSSPSCIQTDESDARAPVLLYNALEPGAVPPVLVALRVGPDGVAIPTLENQSPHPVGPLWIRWANAVHEIPTIAPGVLVPIPTGDTPSAFQADSPELVDRIRGELVARGLTNEEAGHFVAAWSPDVLAVPQTWTAFGLLSPDAIDEAYPLTLDPAPERVVRVLAFSVEENENGGDRLIREAQEAAE